MENKMTVFSNSEFGKVRTIYQDGKIYFVASDVAKALGYANTRDAVARHCRGVVKRDIPTTGGVQKMSVIPEGDIYRLATHSKLPTAENFEAWVFDEVLPSIRKTGSYSTKQVIPKLTPQPHYKARMVKTAIRDARGTARPVTYYRYALFARSRHFIILHDKSYQRQHKQGNKSRFPSINQWSVSPARLWAAAIYGRALDAVQVRQWLFLPCRDTGCLFIQDRFKALLPAAFLLLQGSYNWIQAFKALRLVGIYILINGKGLEFTPPVCEYLKS